MTREELIAAMANNDAERRRVNGEFLTASRALQTRLDALGESDAEPLPALAVEAAPEFWDRVAAYDADLAARLTADPPPELHFEPEARDTLPPDPHREDFESPAEMLASIEHEIAPADAKAGWRSIAFDWQLELDREAERAALAELQAEIDAKVAACTHEPTEAGVCSRCGALKHDDGEGWEAPLAKAFFDAPPPAAPESDPVHAEITAESETADPATSAPAESA